MRGNTPAKAVNAYLDALQRALSCGTTATVVASGYQPSAHPIAVVLNRAAPVSLSGGSLPVALRVEQHIVLHMDPAAPIRDRWRVSLSAYRYTLLEPVTSRELLAFHWHPQPERSDRPHLHLGSSILPVQTLANRHIPTGFITIEDVLTFAIAELKVTPRRAAWARVLADTRPAAAMAMPELP